MAEILFPRLEDLKDPALRQITQHVVHILELAAQKAVAHRANKAKYPLHSDENALEHLFLERFDGLHALKQEIAIKKVMHAVESAPENREYQYKSLAAIDLTSETPVVTQAEEYSLPEDMQFFPETLGRLLPPEALTASRESAATAQLLDASVTKAEQETFNKLALRLKSVTCVDETGPHWTNSLGQDEIYLSIIASDPSGHFAAGTNTKIGDFDSGLTVDFPTPTPLTTFELPSNAAGLHSYMATFALYEQDMGDNSKYIRELVKVMNLITGKSLGSKVSDWLSTCLTGLAGVSALSAPVAAAAISVLVVSYALPKILDWMAFWYEDDQFAPIPVSIILPDANPRFENNSTTSPEFTLTFKGQGGEYLLKYDWQLHND